MGFQRFKTGSSSLFFSREYVFFFGSIYCFQKAKFEVFCDLLSGRLHECVHNKLHKTIQMTVMHLSANNDYFINQPCDTETDLMANTCCNVRGLFGQDMQGGRILHFMPFMYASVEYYSNLIKTDVFLFLHILEIF